MVYAVRLMLLGAALEIVAAVVADVTNESLQPQFAASMHRYGAAEVHAVTVAHGQTVVLNSTAACVIWLVIACANWRARSRAPRIISAILFVIGTEYLGQTFSDPNTVPTLIIAVVIWLIGLSATVLLFAKAVQVALRRRSTLSGT